MRRWTFSQFLIVSDLVHHGELRNSHTKQYIIMKYKNTDPMCRRSAQLSVHTGWIATNLRNRIRNHYHGRSQQQPKDY